MYSIVFFVLLGSRIVAVHAHSLAFVCDAYERHTGG